MSRWKLLVAVVPIFLLLDLIWLGIVMKGFYGNELGDLARREGDVLAPRWGAALLVYLLIPGGIVLFVRPLLRDNATAWQAFGWGVTFGLVIYGVYDLTNYSILANWSLRMTVADILWGCVVCGTTSYAMQLAAKWIPE
jgi:uncharacterized membrane protein